MRFSYRFQVAIPFQDLRETGPEYPNFLHGCDFLCFNLVNYLWIYIVSGSANLKVCLLKLALSHINKQRVLANHDGDGNESGKTKGLMSRTIAVHMRFEFSNLSLPCSSCKTTTWKTKFYPEKMRSWFLASTYFGGLEPQCLIFRIFFRNWTMSLHVYP